jgi:hypothetical protein
MRNSPTILCVLFLMACSGTKITHSWKAPDVTNKKYQEILVIAVAKDTDADLKIMMENHLIDDLKSSGYRATSALVKYGSKAFAGMEKEKVAQKLSDDGIDAVMTIVLLDKKQEKEYIPSRIFHSPYYVSHNHFLEYYNTITRRIETTGYYSTSTKYFWESNFYDVKNRKLVYSVQTQSFDPTTTRAMAHKYGKLIVQDILTKKVLDSTILKLQ